MAGRCSHHRATNTPSGNDKRWTCVIWIALILNALMFVIEIGTGAPSHSASLRADALDFSVAVYIVCLFFSSVICLIYGSIESLNITYKLFCDIC